VGGITVKYACKKCSVEITPEENTYSMKHYGMSLCRIHQKDSLQGIPLSSNGLSKRETRYKEGMIKGRIAEALIEELFLALDYNVYRYGMENTVPGIIKLLKGVRSDVADTIKKMPDFVIQNTKTGAVYFVEVKFRANEELSFLDIGGKDYPFENAFFIVVSTKHIKCISYEELKSGKTITPTSHNYLGNRSEFALDKEVIIQFCDFAVKFFSEV
jgi:hypothetical protein